MSRQQKCPHRLAELKEELTRGSSPTARVIPIDVRGRPGPDSGVISSRSEANLFDFVQFECMRGLTRAVIVYARGESGILYFDEGQIVHAETSGLEGEEAALVMLCWQHVSIEASSSVWVNPNTIDTSWQGLLMMAAQRLDESLTESDSRVQQPPAEKVFSNLEEFVEFQDANLTRAVRLDSEGEIITSRGEMHEFPDAASYAVRLAELIGEGLGLENFSGLECVTNKRIMLTYIDEDMLVAVEGDLSTDLSQHRKRAGT